ncbi:MAG: Hcp family type VI secretion system effector [Alphaproteobacteria bacterium]
MRIVTLMAALIVAALPITAQAAVDYFLKIEGIKGEAAATGDSHHTDWIPIESYTLKDDGSVLVRELDKSSTKLQTMGTSQSSAAGRTRGETTLGDVVVVRELDKSSTKLQEALTDGTNFAKLTIAQQVEGRMETVYVLEQVRTQFVKSRSTSGDADDRPTEEVAFYYNKIAFAAPDTGSSSAAKGGNVETEWKVEKGEK